MGLTLSAADYLAQLQALLPPGPAWGREQTAVLTRLLDAWAAEFGRLHGRVGSLMAEAEPRSTAEMLGDWERCLALPDACSTSASSFAERRAAVVAKLVGIGGQSPAYYIALAASLGYAITITEFRPHSVDDDVEYPITGEAWAHTWQVNAAQDTVRDLLVTDDVAMPLAVWGNALLECAISRTKPAHSIVLFAYT